MVGCMAGVTEPDFSPVTIVGAGPTGLTLAVELCRAGVPFRIVDSAGGAVHESRALAIQARTLEVLGGSAISAELVAAGAPARSIALHARRTVAVPLFDEANTETAYPFILFLSQAETERILLSWLKQRDVTVERGARVGLVRSDVDGVTFEVETAAGREVRRTGYLIGCDGAHSAVRAAADIPFAGSGFPQSFAIADLEVDGLPPDRVHAFVSAAGILFFFPLGTPASWRLLGMLPDAAAAEPLDLEHLQRLVDSYTAGSGLSYQVSSPVWVTTFKVQSRRAQQFRKGRVFLAGDAAHIHSPAGAQGMNTGIQDAVNLGWKLAQVIQGIAVENLLDTYQDERLPVARSVLRMTDRLFRMATTPTRLVRWLRPRLAPAVLSLVVRSRTARQVGFRSISQLALDYRSGTVAGSAGQISWRGLRAGDRLPDIDVIDEGGHRINLRESLVIPNYLLVGANVHPASDWGHGLDVLLAVQPGEPSAWLLIRPDGYLAGIWRSDSGVRAYLRQWVTPARQD